MLLLIQDSISINGEEILRAGTSGFEVFLRGRTHWTNLGHETTKRL